jgi:hypothetical protein
MTGWNLRGTCAATDAAASARCRRSGLLATVCVERQDVIDAILSQHGEQLSSFAANRLADRQPHPSARSLSSTRRRCAIAAIAILLVALEVFWPAMAKAAALVAFPVLFLAVSALKLASAVTTPRITMPAGPRLRDEDLPVYTALVPLFGETSVLPQIIGSLKGLNYPAGKLDVKIIVEEGDGLTREMVRQLVPGTGFDIITVSPGKPQTKPPALNLALMFARGDLLTIYDAEDIPQPMQLRVAAQSFAAAPPEVACLHARLAYYNSNENWLTRQFAIEYASLFDLMLPLLARLGLPLPLGGTSNHFRHGALRAAAGWDAWNVTEDADLAGDHGLTGISLAQNGHARLSRGTGDDGRHDRLGPAAPGLSGDAAAWPGVCRTRGFLTGRTTPADHCAAGACSRLRIGDAGRPAGVAHPPPARAHALGADHACVLAAHIGGRLDCPVATGASTISLEQDTPRSQPGISQILKGRRGKRDGAGEGNRTLVVSLGSFCSTIELHPPQKLLLHRLHGF